MLVKNEIILVLGCDVFIEQREDKLLVEYNDFGNDLWIDVALKIAYFVTYGLFTSFHKK